MALIKNSMSAGMAREAIILNLSDLQRQADEIKTRARDQAAKIIDEAEEQRRQIIADAADIGRADGREEGRAKGRAEGLAAGKAEALEQTRALVEGAVAAWTAALADFEGARDRMLIEARSDVLELAMDIARKVTKRIVQNDPGVVAAQLEAALTMTLGRTRLVVSAHPEDTAHAAEALSALMARLGGSGHAEIVQDASIGRGSCIVRSERGMVDASIDVQLERIAEALGIGKVECAAASTAAVAPALTEPAPEAGASDGAADAAAPERKEP